MALKIPQEYSAKDFERIVRGLEKQISDLRAELSLKEVKSVSASAAPQLAINRLGYVINDSQNLDLLVRAKDGRLYRISSLVAASDSVLGSGGTSDHGALSGLGDNDHLQYVLDAGDTMTGALVIDGSADAIQLRVQGNATQTNNIFEVEDSAAANKLTVANNGKVFIAGEVEIDGALNHDGANVGFFGVAPTTQPAALTQTYSTADRTLSAYTSDPESSAYTGIDNAQAGTVYAQVSDLNALRTAYENLRAFTEDAVAFLNSLVDDMQLNGLEQ